MSTILFFLSVSWLILPLIIYLPLLHLKPRRTQKRKVGIEKAINLPPSPPQLPIIGNLHQVGKLHHQIIHNLSQKYGPDAMLLKLGSTKTLIISSARMAKLVLQIHDIDFCSRPSLPASKHIFYDNKDVVFSPYSDHWREMRKVFVSLVMSSKRQESFWEARVSEVDHLIGSLSRASTKPVNLEEMFFSLVDGVIGSAAFRKSYRGKQFNGQKLKDVLVEVMDTLNGASMEDFFPSCGWIIDFASGHRSRVRKCFRKIDGYLERVLEEHLDPNREDCEDQDLVDDLIEYSNQENRWFHFTREHIKAILMNTYLGGVDTSAITMVWAMAELIKNPRVMKKLQEEIRSSIGKKPRIKMDDLAKLPYLKMVVKETFRKHPASPLLVPHENTRQCKLECENCSFDVPAKTRVLVNVWAIGRDPKIWRNPNEFSPERFEENEIEFNGKHFELLPFGAGRRSCPGVATSISTIEYTLANILYWFDWEVAEGESHDKMVLDLDMEEGGGLLCHKKTPLVLVPIEFHW